MSPFVSVCAGLLSESLALIDLLVLVHARHFTGLLGSSFSWIVQVRHCTVSVPMSQPLDAPSCTSFAVRPPCIQLR